MKQFLILLFLLALPEVKAQRYFADYMSIGTSLTYMRNVNRDSYGINSGYDEYTFNLNSGIRLSKKFFSGLHFLNIFSSEPSTKKDYYMVYGIFTQYTLLEFSEHKLLVELSMNKGSYCTCDPNPYKINGLYYLGVGGGFELPLPKWNGFFLDLSFINYAILNQVENKYAYTQYVIGINYRFND